MKKTSLKQFCLFLGIFCRDNLLNQLKMLGFHIRDQNSNFARKNFWREIIFEKICDDKEQMILYNNFNKSGIG